MGNKVSENEKLLEKERKEKLADELQKQALFEEKRLEKRKLQVLEEMKNLNITEEEYWNHISLEQLKKDKNKETMTSMNILGNCKNLVCLKKKDLMRGYPIKLVEHPRRHEQRWRKRKTTVNLEILGSGIMTKQRNLKRSQRRTV